MGAGPAAGKFRGSATVVDLRRLREVEDALRELLKLTQVPDITFFSCEKDEITFMFF